MEKQMLYYTMCTAPHMESEADMMHFHVSIVPIPVYSGFNATAVSLEGDKPIGILHHECFGNGERVHFVRLGLADVVLAHS